MSECQKTNFLFKVVLQVLLVFCCLTIFYYNYVISVEKTDVATQLDIVVARLLGDKSQYAFLNDSKVQSRGALEGIKEKQIIDMIDSTQNVQKSNQQLQNQSITLLWQIIGFLLAVVALVWVFIGCVNIKQELKEGAIMCVFIILTEFIFLNSISKNYISADPNHMMRTVCETLIQKLSN